MAVILSTRDLLLLLLLLPDPNDAARLRPKSVTCERKKKY
jgi:hypothetical protein